MHIFEHIHGTQPLYMCISWCILNPCVCFVCVACWQGARNFWSQAICIMWRNIFTAQPRFQIYISADMDLTAWLSSKNDASHNRLCVLIMICSVIQWLNGLTKSKAGGHCSPWSESSRSFRVCFTTLHLPKLGQSVLKVLLGRCVWNPSCFCG